MNPELQSVVDRLETVERQSRGWKLLVVVALLLASAAIAIPILSPAAAPVSHQTKFSVIEANRFLLRDRDGHVAGGLEVDRDGAIKLVLGRGYGAMGAAFMEVRPDGIVHVTLRGSDGGVRAALVGARTPSLALASEGKRPGATLRTAADGLGALLLTDATGRTRFRAP